MVCLRRTGASVRIPTLPREGQRQERRGYKCEERRGADEERARQDGEQRGAVSEKAASSSSASHSRSEPRDKPLLMEEINFGLNRSPATL